MSLEPHYIAGLDLGQSQDFSALVIVEVQQWIPGWTVTPGSPLYRVGLTTPGWVSPAALTRTQRDAVDAFWHERPSRPMLTVPHMQRWQLGTSYPRVVEDVVKVLSAHPIGDARLHLIADATGVGAAVVDLFRQSGMPWLIAASIHAGNATTFDSRERTASIPKRDLIGAVSVVLEQRRLQISRALPEAATLERELGTFRRRITPLGHEQMASWRESDHDDLVLGLSLAVWAREWLWSNFDAHVADTQRLASVRG